jgi:hypothetical protein
MLGPDTQNRPSLSRYPTLYYNRQVFYNNIKTSLFISLCILRDLPQRKIPRELCGRGDLTIICHSHVPMERLFDGMDQENSKTQGGKGQMRKIEKENKKERVEERKRRDFDGHGGSHTLCVLHRSGMPPAYCPCATVPQENPLIWEPPSPTTSKIVLVQCRLAFLHLWQR